jgi:hypothetical protein
VGIFRKRRALDPLVVDPAAAGSGKAEQDNSAGRDDPSFEDIKHEDVTKNAHRGWLPTDGEQL